jgi:hypothetical protein
MPPASASTPGAPAADAVSTQLWTVKLKGDTTEIDLCGAVIKSSHPVLGEMHGECAPAPGISWFSCRLTKNPSARHACCCNRHVLYGIVGWMLSRSPVSSDMAVVVQVEGYLKVTAGLHEVDRKVTC